MRTIKKCLLRISELPETEQQKIIDNHRSINTENTDWYEPTLEEFAQSMHLIGADITTDNIRFDLYHNSCWFRAVINTKLMVPILGNKFRPLLLLDDLPWVVIMPDDHRDRMTITGPKPLEIDDEDPLKSTVLRAQFGNTTPEDLWDELTEDILDFCKDSAKKLLVRLREESEWLESDESIKDTLESNDYEFEYPEQTVMIWNKSKEESK